MVHQEKRQRITTVEATPFIIELPGIKSPITIINVGHVDELLEFMCSTQPQDKRCGKYKQWKIAYNALVYIGNKLAGFQRVKTIK